MLAAALLASILAQAEQAPAPAPPAAPAAAAPTPDSGPAEPAPAAAAPAPAEAAPATPPPPAATAPAPAPAVADEAPALPRNSLSVQLRYAYRVGSDGDSTGPSAGMSLGGEFEHRFLAHRNGIEIGGAFDFFYDRFSKQEAAISTGPAGPTGTVVDRTLSQTSFALLATAAWRQTDTRIFVAGGGGMTIGYFTSPDMFSGSKTAAQPLARGVVGMDFALTPKIAAILRVDYDHSFNHQSYGSALLFGDIFNAGAGLLLRF
jgi:hypothetical protein